MAILIPAYNEQENLPRLVTEIRNIFPECDIVVVNDGSQDATAIVARECGAIVLDLPCNLGVGGALQAAFRYAVMKDYDLIVRIDGDGQHPPAEIPGMLDYMRTTPCDLLIGVRANDGEGYQARGVRSWGSKGLSAFLSWICHRPISDPTSGFWIVRRPLLHCFAAEYPTEYPEPEAIAMLYRQGFCLEEIEVVFRPRQYGQSTIQGWDTIYYALKVGLSLTIDLLRPRNKRITRAAIMRTIATTREAASHRKGDHA